jgi:hypothetical protein
LVRARATHHRHGYAEEGTESDDGPSVQPHHPQPGVHRRSAGAGGCLGSLVDLDTQRANPQPGRVGSGSSHRGWRGTVRLVCLELRSRGTGHSRPVGRIEGVVATGPYRWVRNPIYIAALLIVLGEAWLFTSLPLLGYAGAMAIFFHLFVVGYEEPALTRRFDGTYLAYRHAVPRWIPCRPRHADMPR